VTGAVAGASELDVAAVLEDTIEERLGQIGIVEHVPPRRKRLVGGEEHGLASEIALVHHLEEDVGGILGEGEVADLVEHQDVRVRVGVERRRELAGARGVGQLLDERGRGGEAGLEAVLDGPVGDRDGETRLPRSGPRKLPRSWRRIELWKVKSKSSMVARKGKRAWRTLFWMRVWARCAISSAASRARKSR
jgi:hypothetical protein